MIELNFSDYFDPLIFFIALFIGLFYTGLTTPPPEIIIKYPTKDNAGKIIYKDRMDVCYKYIAKDVPCPADKTKIKKLDLQHDEVTTNPVIQFINGQIDKLFPNKKPINFASI